MEGVVKLILVVHVDDIVVSGGKEACEELHHTLNENFPTENLGELKWYLGCAVERDWQQGSCCCCCCHPICCLRRNVSLDTLLMTLQPGSQQ